MVENTTLSKPTTEERLAVLQQAQDNLDLMRTKLQEGTDCDFILITTHADSDNTCFDCSASLFLIAQAAKSLLEHMPPPVALIIVKAIQKGLMHDVLGEEADSVELAH